MGGAQTAPEGVMFADPQRCSAVSAAGGRGLWVPTVNDMVAVVEAAMAEAASLDGRESPIGGGGWFVPGDGDATGDGLWRLLLQGWMSPAGDAPGKVLPFVVKAGAEVVGVQGLSVPPVGVGEPAETWSWMMPSRRGRGHGLRARRAVLAVAFDVCRVAVCVSTHVQHNRASGLVSARAGYLKMGMVWAQGEECAVELWRHDAVSWRAHVAGLPRAERPVVASKLLLDERVRVGLSAV